MGLRPARTCRDIERPWTRTAKRKVKKSFVRGVPDSRVRTFEMGALNPQEAEIKADLVADGKYQMRDNAFESARVMANKQFEKKITLANYYFKIKTFPHQCIREHSMLTGAGADRLSSGMRLAFGRPVGRAVVTRKNQALMTIYTMKKFEAEAKEGLKRATLKLPGKCKIVIKEITDAERKKLPSPKKRRTEAVK